MSDQDQNSNQTDEQSGQVIVSDKTSFNPTVPDAEQHPVIFRSRLDGITYVFPNGKAVMFKDRKYETTDMREINHLHNEVALGHPTLYFGDPETVVDAKTGIVVQGVVSQESGDDVVVEQETADPARIHDDASAGIKATDDNSQQDAKQSDSGV